MQTCFLGDFTSSRGLGGGGSRADWEVTERESSRPQVCGGGREAAVLRPHAPGTGVPCGATTRGRQAVSGVRSAELVDVPCSDAVRSARARRESALGAARPAVSPVSWRRPSARGSPWTRPGGDPRSPLGKPEGWDQRRVGARWGRAVLPGRDPPRPPAGAPPTSPSPPTGPAPGRRAPPSRARAGGVAFKSSPVFWGPRAGRADLVRMSRAVTPAPGSMCAAEGRIIWPAARAGGRTGGASAAGPGGPTGGASTRGRAPPAPPPPGPAGAPGPASPRTRALP